MEGFYYVIEGKNINKYLVSFDVDKLMELRCEIINNCSNIVHVGYRTVDEFDDFDTEHIRKYISYRLGVRSCKNLCFGSPVGAYVDYDYYEHSRLVLIIDNLLKGNMNSLDDLFCFCSIYGPKLEELKSKIESTKLIDDEESEKLSVLLDSYVFDIKSDKSELEKIEKVYLVKVRESINLNFIDSINVEVFESVRDFFNDSSINKNVSSGLKRVLKVKGK